MKLDLKDKILFSMIGIIVAGIGWMITQNQMRLDEHQRDIETLKSTVYDLRNISSNLIEAYNGKVEKDKQQDAELQKNRDEIMELWKCTKRGASKDLTLKE